MHAYSKLNTIKTTKHRSKTPQNNRNVSLSTQHLLPENFHESQTLEHWNIE